MLLSVGVDIVINLGSGLDYSFSFSRCNNQPNPFSLEMNRRRYKEWIVALSVMRIAHQS
jgi:hypothetical protein